MSIRYVVFGDLHFHTRYSDNRDRATVRQMFDRAAGLGLGVVGTGDHNHNLTAASWYAELQETDACRKELHTLTVLNNCEMTFLAGHFLAFSPRTVDGSIGEAYRTLYRLGGDRRAKDGRDSGLRHPRGRRTPLVMINHPGLPSDEWETRINPWASAIEVINGGVLREARRSGFSVREVDEPLSIPALRVYARYLRAGIVTSAMGSSDAHTIEEVGLGVTAFRLPGRCSEKAVLRAIRRAETFAATDTGARLLFSKSGNGRLQWKVSFAASADAEVWIYDRDVLLAKVGPSGTIRVRGAGPFWLAARSGDRFAVSSPVVNTRTGRLAAFRSRPELPADAAVPAARDLSLLDAGFRTAGARENLIATGGGGRHGGGSAPHEAAGNAGAARWAVSAWCDGEAILTDRDGGAVAARVVSAEPARIVMDKRDVPADAAREFLVWLERNEMHECRFTLLTLGERDGILYLDAVIVPALDDCRTNPEERFRRRGRDLEAMIGRAQKASLHVRLPRRVTLELTVPQRAFPLRLRDGAVTSEIRMIDLGVGVRLLPRQARAPALGSEPHQCIVDSPTDRTSPAAS